MANYLLLRNNKESGPYSLDDLRDLGLKPYDLVWIQGKSAAWRYPSEIEELKSFAPAMEEQPFDRFFKKASELNKEESTQTEIPAIAPGHEKYIPGKSVYVTMPGKKNTAAKTPIKQETLPSSPVQPTITVSENPAAAQIKYSQPLDEIKEMYVRTLHDRKQRIARKGFWLQSLKKAAVLLILVAIGVIAGFMLKSNRDKQESGVQIHLATQSAQSSSPVVTQEKKDTADIVQNVRPLPEPSGGFVNKEVLEENKPVRQKQDMGDSRNSLVKKELSPTVAGNEIKNSIVAQGVDIDPVTGERNHKVRGNSTEENHVPAKVDDKPYSTSELGGLVTVSSNNYKKVAFGGIRNLELTVINDSKFVLDNVTVELQYIKPNELPLRTENIRFSSVAPKTTSTIKIPDTNRGIKIAFRIINITKHLPDDGVAEN